MDFVLVNHNLLVGEISERHNYTGIFGFVTMDLSITVLCALNFQGTDCTQCIRDGFSGPNCTEQINDCVGVDCGNGVCVDGVNSFTCDECIAGNGSSCTKLKGSLATSYWNDMQNTMAYVQARVD